MIAVPLLALIITGVLFVGVCAIASAALIMWWRAIDDVRRLRIEVVDLRSREGLRSTRQFRP